MSGDAPSAVDAAKLEKQLRVLERKLERSEWHRVDLENQHDRDQHLYRRLQADLETAKREAEIEAALERLRARTMAMQSSDELADTASLLYALYRGLGYTPWRFIILQIDNEEQTGTVWLTDAEGQVVPIGTHIPLTEEAHFAGVLAAFQEGASSHSFTLQGKSRVAWTEYITRRLGLPLPEYEEGAKSDEELRTVPAVMNLAYFSHGALMVHTIEPISEEQQGVLQRFARVFGMTYRRFLDLKQAEEQAREAQIEGALERVRSRAMGMQKSEELQEIIKVVHDHIAAIGIHADHAGFIIDYKNRDDMHIVLVDDQNDVPSELFIPYFDSPHWNSFREARSKGGNHFTNDLDFDEKNRFYEQLLELIPDVPDETREFLLGCPGLSLSTVLLDNVGLYIENFSARPYTDEENRTLLRFGNVFQQAYTRYLDLEQAENRAREAQIEAAMERVRSRALAMTTSDELLDVVFRIHQEFAGLGLPCEQFWHTRYTPEVYQKALTGVGGEKLAAIMELPRDFSSQPALAAWERGDEKIGVFTFDADAACTYLHHMITKGHFDEVDPEGITEEMVRENGGFTFVQARTSHGEIGYTLWGETDPGDEAKDVLIRFTGAFDLAYRRFEDLQQAEQQAALDRLRAEIASTLTRDADVTAATFHALEAEIRTLTGRLGLRLGLATLQADGELNARPERRIWNSLLIRDALRAGALDWRRTLYGTALERAVPLAVSDVESDGSLDEGLREILLAQGIRSLALQPLRTADRTVGLFELSSSEAGAVDDSTLLTMARLEPTFALAVTQNLEGFETRVESAIQHAYTAFHPSVRWRFRDAAIEMLERGHDTVEPEPVVFEGVHALYGAADIRASTHHRNEAVRHDVLGSLGRARDALSAIHRALPLTILDELGLRVRKRIEQYERAWNAGDEAAADRFLTEDVEPVLERMTAGRADLVSILETYRSREGEGAVLRSDAYEASRRAINRAVSDVLLAEEAETQRLFPHYLELTRTDGVEHTLYIGPSIAPDRPFDLAYVENLRLRQLIAACAVAREVRRLGETLPMPLAIAQLVVVQHAPITLRFRADEKRFDVDSPSGVRFELLKKRLDKACVKGTAERINQPDRIAVVYSTEDEEAEYRRYAEYLAAQEHIQAEFEKLEVEDLPGAAGLRMLRMKVASSG